MPTSSEFVDLCRAQIALLTNGFGASFSAVYLAEESADSSATKLIPVVTHPEAEAWREELPSFWSTGIRSASLDVAARRPLLLPDTTASENSSDVVDVSVQRSNVDPDPRPEVQEQALSLPQQMVLPLVHEGVMVGLLVTARPNKVWSPSEQAQIEEIAQTLAIACVLDQRSQWLERDLRQQRRLQTQQHDIFDDLLHQFRNPLTALRTFGKLLLRRLATSDANRNVATSIMRESDRLQELLEEFDAAIDMGEADLLPSDLEPSPYPAEWKAHLQASDLLPEETSSVTEVSSVPLLPGGGGLLSGTLLHLEPHPLREVLEPLIDSAEAIAQDRQLNLWVHLPDRLPPVQLDLRALREVLNNLIDNALKYTPAGGTVQIDVIPQHQHQAIIIADTGTGIPAQDLEHVFERHYRGAQANTDIPGTGLGLAIARDLVVRMHGDIRVYSPAKLMAQEFEDSALQMLSDRLLDVPNHPGTAVIVWLPEA